MSFYRQNCLNLIEYGSIFYQMSDKMPEGLRKHFEEKEKEGKHEGPGEEKKELARKEALRKAQKAKMKRQAEKKSAERWFSALKTTE